MANVPEQSAAASSAGDLVVQCLELLEREGPEAVEALLERHLSEAEEVRARLRKLSQLGFLLLQEPASKQELPERLGSFRLLERFGAGGMGVVFLAEDEILSRSVALKVVRPDLLLIGNARERFRREVEAVARLKHPGILPVYSAGEEGGVPFFTMEFVEGCTLSEVVSRLSRKRPAELSGTVLSAAIAALSPAVGEGPAKARFGTTWTEACFQLALAIAEALQHAHERGVLHRDVKPSNVMVTRDGRVVLMDFGLASSSESSRITQSGSHVGSLPYMSPEQIRGDAEVIGEKSDVYSLGVTLYELLTLRCPYLAPNAEVTRKKILEGVPPPIRSLNPQVPWDAETVCLTAMDFEPNRRYATAAAFAADLANFLEHRPIRARRPGMVLRSRRFAERHPVASVAATLGFLILVGGAVFAAVQVSTNRELRAANHDKDTALSDAKTALARKDEINEILGNMIGAPNPWQDDPINPVTRDTKVVEVLDQARDQLLETGRELDPTVEAEVGGLLGKTYVSLLLYDQAEPLLVRTRDLSRQLYGEASPEHVDALFHLAKLRYGQRRFDESVELLEEALLRCNPATDPLARDVLNDLALSHHALGNLERAEELHRRQLELCDPDDWPGLALACHNLGSLLSDQRAFEEASELLERSLDLRQRDLPPDHPRILSTKNELGFVRMKLRRFSDAFALFEELSTAFERTLGETHEHTLAVQANVAWALVELERFVEAEEQARAVISRESSVVQQPGHPVPLMARVHLVKSLAGQGKLLEAAAAADESMNFATYAPGFHRTSAMSARQDVLERLEEAVGSLADELEEARSLHGGYDASTVSKVCELAAMQRALGRSEDALILVEEALREREESSPEAAVEIGGLQHELGLCLLDLEVHEEAEAVLRQALASYEASLGIDDPRTQALIHDLVRCLEARGQRPEAQEYRQLLSARADRSDG